MSLVNLEVGGEVERLRPSYCQQSSGMQWKTAHLEVLTVLAANGLRNPDERDGVYEGDAAGVRLQSTSGVQFVRSFVILVDLGSEPRLREGAEEFDRESEVGGKDVGSPFGKTKGVGYVGSNQHSNDTKEGLLLRTASLDETGEVEREEQRYRGAGDLRLRRSALSCGTLTGMLTIDVIVTGRSPPRNLNEIAGHFTSD